MKYPYFFFYFVIAVITFFAGCQLQEQKKSVQKDTVKVVTSVAKPQSTKEIRRSTNKIYNDIARYLAGMKQEDESRLTDLEKNFIWQKYAVSSDSTWARLERRQLSKIKTWASQELPTPHSSLPTIFYPFSGPDFLNVFNFFPNNKKYVLIGLEPVGIVPDVEKIPTDSLNKYFSSIRKSMDDVLNISFFKTNEMKEDFQNEELEGTLPVLFIFLVRTGNKIVDVQPIEIGDSGKITNSSFASVEKHDAKKMNGVEIIFENKNGSEQQSLCYFSVDLSDVSLKKKNNFAAFLNQLGSVTTYLKSASYLMHKSYFSIIRNHILNQSELLLQDDSGIPFHFFEKEKWSISLFGIYKKPISLFKNWEQEDMRNAYQDSINKAKSLPFGIGYSWHSGQSNLLLARKK